MGDVLTINRTPQDFVSKTRHLSVEDRGAYQEILDQIVILGQDVEPPSLPDDARFIANLLGWSVTKWRATRARLSTGPHAVLVVESGRVSQTRIVEEIEAAKARIAAGKRGGIASGKARRTRLRERMLNGRSVTVQPPREERSNESRTSYESRATSHEVELPPSSATLLAADDGIEAIDMLRDVIRQVAPIMILPDDQQIAGWLRDIHPEPWAIAAVICEAQLSLQDKRHPNFIRKMLSGPPTPKWLPKETAQEMVTYCLSPARQRGHVSEQIRLRQLEGS